MQLLRITGIDRMYVDVPYARVRYVASRLLLQKGAHLLDLAPSCSRIVQEVTQLAGVWFDVNRTLGCSRITFQNQNLMLWATLLPNGMH
jgi:hypothetical protein